jgi:hypothetical protein
MCGKWIQVSGGHFVFDRNSKMVLGSIAVKSQMALAPSALSHLESAYILFSQVSGNPRAAEVLVSMFTVE